MRKLRGRATSHVYSEACEVWAAAAVPKGLVRVVAHHKVSCAVGLVVSLLLLSLALLPDQICIDDDRLISGGSVNASAIDPLYPPPPPPAGLPPSSPGLFGVACLTPEAYLVLWLMCIALLLMANECAADLVLLAVPSPPYPPPR